MKHRIHAIDWMAEQCKHGTLVSLRKQELGRLDGEGRNQQIRMLLLRVTQIVGTLDSLRRRRVNVDVTAAFDFHYSEGLDGTQDKDEREKESHRGT